MLFAEKESNLIEVFQDLMQDEVALFPLNEETIDICDSIRDESRWINWIDSSAKNDPPPDFYNDKEQLMMEVMRVDDHGFRRKGKTVNPTLDREHQLERELSEKAALSRFPDTIKIFINADSGLPTKEDHNYQYYCDGFKRTIEKHKMKIVNYKKNHPDYKIVFFVFDESTAYIQMKKVPANIWPGRPARGEAHQWYADRRFIDVFRNSGIDFLIWVAPYKLIHSIGRAPYIPTACVFDCNKINYELIDYDSEHMVSSEM